MIVVENEKTGELVLICWCSPASCHGDILKDIIENWNTKPWLEW